jgi:hypothetical protein
MIVRSDCLGSVRGTRCQIAVELRLRRSGWCETRHLTMRSDVADTALGEEIYIHGVVKIVSPISGAMI